MRKYLRKQIKIREENLKYDFLPPMIEIIERPANRLGTVIMFLIIAMLVSSIIWAALFKTDIVVTAAGTAMPEGGIIPLKSIRGGRVCEVIAEEGAYVKKGDAIIKLENKEAQVNYAKSRYESDTLEMQKKAYTALYEYLISDIYSGSLPLDASEYGEYSSIADTIILENEIFFNKLNELDGEQKENAKKERILSLLQNLNALDTKIQSANLNLQNAENELNNYVITAPYDGKLTQTASINEGSVIGAGDTLGYIIPSDKENIFTAYVSNNDAGQIKLGSPAGIKIEAYRDTEYQYMEGEIISISDTAFNAENMGSVYMVEISIDNLPKDIKIGMEGRCDIIIGQRSVLDYFLEPFRKGLNGSLKER